MATKITSTELEKSLTEILDRIRYGGERFVIQRNGESIATLTPVGPPAAMTLHEFVKLLESLPAPDDAFADDLDAIQSMQGFASIPE